ncbi:hypothetical protein DQ240_20755 [Blastococcus sp. TF02A-26]|nr:hypothetical protein DQ240_20755 [Blastococcus sp. TF02A-26]
MTGSEPASVVAARQLAEEARTRDRSGPLIRRGAATVPRPRARGVPDPRSGEAGPSGTAPGT